MALVVKITILALLLAFLGPSSAQIVEMRDATPGVLMIFGLLELLPEGTHRCCC